MRPLSAHTTLSLGTPGVWLPQPQWLSKAMTTEPREGPMTATLGGRNRPGLQA